MKKLLKNGSLVGLLACGLALSVIIFGLPPKDTLATECDQKLVPWALNRPTDVGGLQYCIGFSIPVDYAVDVSETEEEVRYFVIHKIGSKVTLVHIYFGNHPYWPPPKTFLQKERMFGPTANSQVLKTIGFWSLGSFQAETLINKMNSKLQAKVLANYSTRSRKDAALAEKIIQSILIKDPCY